MRICRNMSRFFIKPLLAAAALLTASTAEAIFFYDEQGVQYNVLDETTCEVGDNKYYSGNAIIPEEVTYEGKNYTVTQIGRRAFNGATKLTEVHIPKTVTVVYDNAFSGSNVAAVRFEDGEEPVEFKQSSDNMVRVFAGVPLESVYIGRDFILPGGLWEANPPFSRNETIYMVEIGDLVTSLPSYAFSDCYNLISVRIGSGLKTIGEEAFEETGVQNLYIDNLEQWCNVDFGDVYSNPLAYNKGWLHVGDADVTYDIVIPDGVTKIKPYTFAGAKLHTVTVPSGVTEIGDEAFAYCADEFQAIYLPDGLKSIGFAAFGTSTLQTIEIPESVTSLGDNMFLNCKNLREARINANVTGLVKDMFNGCKELQTVTLPPALRVIPEGAFLYCQSLQSIEIPESVREIGESAFQWSGLTSITIPDNVVSLGGNCFSMSKSLATVNIGSGLTAIPKSCFTGAGLTSITLPDNVITLEAEAFSECASLAEVNLGKGLKQISDRCFQNSGLKSISIPSNVTSIGEEEFAGCASLETVDLSTRLREIPEKCFQNSGLTAITLPENVTTVGGQALSGCLSLRSVTVSGPKTFEDNAFGWTNNIQSVYIDDLADWCERTSGSRPVGEQLYVNGELVENLMIPDGVVRVGDYSFAYYKSIKTVVVPDGVVSVGRCAFYCPEMTKATVGKNVNTIGSSAFSSEKLEEFICWNPVPPAGSGLMLGSYMGPVYVPAGSVDAYKNSEDWWLFNIKAIGDGGVEEIDGGGLSVSVVDGRIVVSGADNDAVVEVYDFSGRRIYAGAAAEIPLTDGGVYVVKVAGQAFKMAI